MTARAGSSHGVRALAAAGVNAKAVDQVRAKNEAASDAVAASLARLATSQEAFETVDVQRKQATASHKTAIDAAGLSLNNSKFAAAEDARDILDTAEATRSTVAQQAGVARNRSTALCAEQHQGRAAADAARRASVEKLAKLVNQFRACSNNEKKVVEEQAEVKAESVAAEKAVEAQAATAVKADTAEEKAADAAADKADKAPVEEDGKGCLENFDCDADQPFCNRNVDPEKPGKCGKAASSSAATTTTTKKPVASMFIEVRTNLRRARVSARQCQEIGDRLMRFRSMVHEANNVTAPATTEAVVSPQVEKLGAVTDGVGKLQAQFAEAAAESGRIKTRCDNMADLNFETMKKKGAAIYEKASKEADIETQAAISKATKAHDETLTEIGQKSEFLNEWEAARNNRTTSKADVDAKKAVANATRHAGAEEVRAALDDKVATIAASMQRQNKTVGVAQRESASILDAAKQALSNDLAAAKESCEALKKYRVQETKVIGDIKKDMDKDAAKTTKYKADKAAAVAAGIKAAADVKAAAAETAAAAAAKATADLEAAGDAAKLAAENNKKIADAKAAADAAAKIVKDAADAQKAKAAADKAVVDQVAANAATTTTTTTTTTKKLVATTSTTNAPTV